MIVRIDAVKIPMVCTYMHAHIRTHIYIFIYIYNIYIVYIYIYTDLVYESSMYIDSMHIIQYRSFQKKKHKRIFRNIFQATGHGAPAGRESLAGSRGARPRKKWLENAPTFESMFG